MILQGIVEPTVKYHSLLMDYLTLTREPGERQC